MTSHAGVIYATGVGATVLVTSAVAETSPWSVALLAIAAPIGPVLVGYLLTRKKLRQQDAKVQEIHVLVNSRLSKTLDNLQAALLENIHLKDRIGIPVSEQERQEATHPEVSPAEVEREIGDIA